LESCERHRMFNGTYRSSGGGTRARTMRVARTDIRPMSGKYASETRRACLTRTGYGPRPLSEPHYRNSAAPRFRRFSRRASNSRRPSSLADSRRALPRTSPAEVRVFRTSARSLDVADRWIHESPLPRGLFRVYSSRSHARGEAFARSSSLVNTLSLFLFLSFSGKSERNPRKILVQFCRGAPYRDSAIIPR